MSAPSAEQLREVKNRLGARKARMNARAEEQAADEREQDLDMALLRSWGLSFREIAKEAGTVHQTVDNRLSHLKVTPTELESRAANLRIQPSLRAPDGLAETEDRPEYLLVEEAAEWAAVSDKTIRRHIKAGLLRASKIGRLIRISEDDFLDYMSKTTAKPEPTNPKIRTIKKRNAALASE